jgi:hypothetical protein
MLAREIALRNAAQTRICSSLSIRLSIHTKPRKSAQSGQKKGAQKSAFLIVDDLS